MKTFLFNLLFFTLLFGHDVTVMPTGGDYSCLDSAITHNVQNWVTATDSCIITISGDWTGDTDKVAVKIPANFVTNATYRLKVHTVGIARVRGKWVSGNYLLRPANLSTTNSWFSDSTAYSEFDGIGFEQSYTNPGTPLDFEGSNLTRVIFRNNVIKLSVQPSYGTAAIHCAGFGNNHVIVNNVIYFTVANNAYGINWYGGYLDTSIIANNTIINAGWEGINNGATVRNIVINNLFDNCRNNAVTYCNASDYNSFSMTPIEISPNNGHNKVGCTFHFVDSANGNFHLVNTDTGALTKGVSLASYPRYSFNINADSLSRGIAWSIGANDTVTQNCTPPTISYAVINDTSCVASTHTPSVSGTPDSIGFIGTWGSGLTSFNHSTGVFIWTPIDTLIAKPCTTVAYKSGCSNVESVCSLKVVYGTIQLDSITPRRAMGGTARTAHGRGFRIYKDSIHVTGIDSSAPVSSCTNTAFVFTPDVAADTGWRDTFIVSNGITADTIFDTAYHVDAPPVYCVLNYATTTGGTISHVKDSVVCGLHSKDTATALIGYRWDRWTRSGLTVSWVDSTSRFLEAWKTDSTNGTVTAHFTRVTYTIAVTASGPGAVGSVTSPQDSGVVFAIAADSGNGTSSPWDSFAHWTAGGGAVITSTTTRHTTMYLTANGTAHALFGTRTAVVPTLDYPANGDTAISKTVTVRWHPNAADSAYTIEIDSTASFNSTLLQTYTVTDTFKNVTLTLNSTSYKWKVLGFNNGSTSAYSSTQTFKTAQIDSVAIKLADGGVDTIRLGTATFISGYTLNKPVRCNYAHFTTTDSMTINKPIYVRDSVVYESNCKVGALSGSMILPYQYPPYTLKIRLNGKLGTPPVLPKTAKLPYRTRIYW